jgi:hypothetical protein
VGGQRGNDYWSPLPLRQKNQNDFHLSSRKKWSTSVSIDQGASLVHWAHDDPLCRCLAKELTQLALTEEVNGQTNTKPRWKKTPKENAQWNRIRSETNWRFFHKEYQTNVETTHTHTHVTSRLSHSAKRSHDQRTEGAYSHWSSQTKYGWDYRGTVQMAVAVLSAPPPRIDRAETHSVGILGI